MAKELSDAGREQIAFALILLKDFRTDGRFDPEEIVMTLGLADHLGVRKQFDELTTRLPLFKVTPRDEWEQAISGARR